MAVETAIHRWDAESAAGEPATLDPDLAVDAIDEFAALQTPKLAGRALGDLHETLLLAATDRPALARAHWGSG